MIEVSIIIPNYNHSAYLESRLESVYGQTFRDFEVILLDDCSTDNSREILEKYKDHAKTSYCVFNSENSGCPFEQWNKGINLAKGDIIWIAETDDFCEPDFLEKTLKPLIGDIDIALSYCQSTRMNSQGEITGSWLTHTDQFLPNVFDKDFLMYGNDFIENYLIHKNVIPNVSAVLFRKSHLKKILPLSYESYMKYNADWYYYIQLLCNSKLAFQSHPLNHFRYHDNSVIAKSGLEMKRYDILKMEMLTRKKIIWYVKNCQSSNINDIINEYKKGDSRLRYIIAKEAIDRKFYLRGIKIIIPYMSLYKKIFRYILNS